MNDIINKIHQGSALEILKTFPDKIVNTCVTSPPYWGLRDYETEGQIWNKEGEGCLYWTSAGIHDKDHMWVDHVKPAANGITHDKGMNN